MPSNFDFLRPKWADLHDDALHQGAEPQQRKRLQPLMKDAVFIIPTPALLERVVTMISGIPMEARDTKGDLYEYLLSKIAQAGVNGQFRAGKQDAARSFLQ